MFTRSPFVVPQMFSYGPLDFLTPIISIGYQIGYRKFLGTAKILQDSAVSSNLLLETFVFTTHFLLGLG
jgi:hypothetical protein